MNNDQDHPSPTSTITSILTPPLSAQQRCLTLTCPTLTPQDPLEASVADRQERVPGFSQQALSRLVVVLVGCGALGGEIAEGLIRKGVGTLKIIDLDTVAMSNLNRQFFFYEDLYQPKAWSLARNLLPHGTMGTGIIAWPISFEQACERAINLDCDVIISAVDNAPTRAAISRFAIRGKIPALFGGAAVNADYANLFVQLPAKACFGCAFPNEVKSGHTPCPGSPAIKDLFKQLGGLALYAVDSLIMKRPRKWNLYSICSSDAAFTTSGQIERCADCPICGGDP